MVSLAEQAKLVQQCREETRVRGIKTTKITLPNVSAKLNMSH